MQHIYTTHTPQTHTSHTQYTYTTHTHSTHTQHTHTQHTYMNIHTHKTKKQLQRLFALSFFLSLNKAPGRTDGMCGVGSCGQAVRTHILCSLACSWFAGLFRALSITLRTTKVTLLSGISASPSVKRAHWIRPKVSLNVRS